jgi:hypothetical protein
MAMKSWQSGFLDELDKHYPNDVFTEAIEAQRCQENLLTEAGLRAQSVVEILRLSSRSRMQNDLRSLEGGSALLEFVRTSLQR